MLSKKPFRVCAFAVAIVLFGLTSSYSGAVLEVKAAGFILRSQAPSCGSDSTPCKFVPLPEPKLGKLNQTAISTIDLGTYPILPTLNSYIVAIYQEGLTRGNNPRVFSKVGDCLTATSEFLEPIGRGDYNLASFTSLQKVIDYFIGVPARSKSTNFDSFTNPSLAAISGFNAAGVLDPTWSDPKWCSTSDSPLTCEYRVSRPSLAIIMFGTNDIKSITPEEYDFYLRRVVVQTINSGIVPLLNTFPTQPGLAEKSVLFNQITVQVALDYNIPLINLWLAFKPLAHEGIDPKNPTHMTKSDSGHSAYFDEANLNAGYNMRNLITLQTLETVLKVVNPDALK